MVTLDQLRGLVYQKFIEKEAHLNQLREHKKGLRRTQRAIDGLLQRIGVLEEQEAAAAKAAALATQRQALDAEARQAAVGAAKVTPITRDTTLPAAQPGDPGDAA